MKKLFSSLTFKIITYVFAVVGLVFTLVFIAMQFGFLDVRGSSVDRNASLGAIPKTDNTNGCLTEKGTVASQEPCDWNKTAEWSVVHDGLLKDQAILSKVSNQTDISERMIAAAVIPEQLRYFTSNRESFKKYFEPLKILSSLSKFSLGVSGIKQDTADRIEQYANDPTSEFYPGAGYRELIAYAPAANHDTELYNRLTDSKNHYYSYLYTALYLKEIQGQWSRAGYDVSKRPDVLVTLFNLGFDASHPNDNPRIAGSVITIGGKDYRFGELGTLFYQSKELQGL